MTSLGGGTGGAEAAKGWQIGRQLGLGHKSVLIELGGRPEHFFGSADSGKLNAIRGICGPGLALDDRGQLALKLSLPLTSFHQSLDARPARMSGWQQVMTFRQLLESLPEFPFCLKGKSQVAVCFAIVGFEFNGYAKLGNRFWHLALLTKREGETVVRFRLFGLKFDGFLKSLNRLRLAALPSQNRTQVCESSIGTGGIDMALEGLAVGYLCLTKFALLGKGEAEAIPSVRIIRPESEGLVKFIDSLGKSVLVPQDVAEVVVGHGEPGLQFDANATSSLRLSQLAPLVHHPADSEVGVGPVWLDNNGLAKGGCLLIMSALVHQGPTKQLISHRTLRTNRNGTGRIANSLIPLIPGIQELSEFLVNPEVSGILLLGSAQQSHGLSGHALR